MLHIISLLGDAVFGLLAGALIGGLAYLVLDPEIAKAMALFGFMVEFVYMRYWDRGIPALEPEEPEAEEPEDEQ